MQKSAQAWEREQKEVPEDKVGSQPRALSEVIQTATTIE